MLLCCRDSSGIIDDIQDSMNEMKLRENEEDYVRNLFYKVVTLTRIFSDGVLPIIKYLDVISFSPTGKT